MDGGQAAAERIRFLYMEQLRLKQRAALTNTEQRRKATALLRLARKGAGRVWRPEAPERIWVWGHLLLGDDEAIDRYKRPFISAEDMEEALFTTWRETVKPDDTVIIAGGATGDGRLRGANREDWNRSPGHKVLVAGSSDVGADGLIDDKPFEEVETAIWLPGEPDLSITATALNNVPAGSVNIHGEKANERRTAKARHIHASVDELEWKPVRPDRLWKLAKQVMREEERAPGSTAERLKTLGTG